MKLEERIDYRKKYLLSCYDRVIVILVTGSRDINNKKYVEGCLWDFHDNFCLSNENNTAFLWVHGGAEGVDHLTDDWVKDNFGQELILEEKPKWKKHGRSAGMIRNVKMVNVCDVGLSIWNGISPGTKHCTELLEKKGKLRAQYTKKMIEGDHDF